jgi:hypothetical protein
MRALPGLVLSVCLVTSPAFATDWRQVSSSDSYLWYDRDSVDIDEDDFLNLTVYRGAWSDPATMSAYAVRVSVDCVDGWFTAYNATTGKWEEPPAGFVTDALSDLAYGICYE